MKRPLILALTAGALLLGGLSTAKADGAWFDFHVGIPLAHGWSAPPPPPTVVISPRPYYYGYREHPRMRERHYVYRYHEAYRDRHWRPNRHHERREWIRHHRWGGDDD